MNDKRKPTITRYYQNQKTGQYAILSGSPIAIRRIENHEWPLQKVVVRRVSGREYRKHIKPVGDVVQSIGWHYIYRHNGAKESRQGLESIGHPLYFSWK